MAKWKDTEGNLHDDMDGMALSLPNWPQGMAEVTDEEATQIIIEQSKVAPTTEAARAERDSRIHKVQWRIDRWHRETRMGQTPTEDIAKLDAYIQALCDVPKQNGFPTKIKWPKEV